jgi:hypothetical protein
MCSGGTFMLGRVFINMEKKWNAIMAVFCILLTACTNSDNTDTNQIIAETSETESVNSEISNSQTAHDVESESSAHKVYPANGSVKKLLSEFAVESRHLSESGRDNAAKFIVNKLQSSGWNVTQKKFPVYRYKNIFSEPYNISENGEPVGTGNNIIAELPNFDRNKPTLILSAHYDTTKDNVGIIDNGSGTAFLLSSGEWLSDFDRDFNLRLIFFDVEESRMYGSKYYLEQLTDEERSKIIADINFDVIGGNHLSVGTVNGFENALSIYLERLAKVESDLSDKGSSSDSDPFMHWQIPAVTYIDLSLPVDPCENSSYIDHVSDESFETLASQLADIINGFDIDEFTAMKNSQIKTDYNGKNIDNIYKAMANISIKGFKTDKLYTAVYENGISSCFCCDYASEDGRSFTIQSLSEVGNEDFSPLTGIPSFEDCINQATNGELLVDKYVQYSIIGNLSNDELMDVWSQMRQ